MSKVSRTITKLPFLFKQVERVVASRLSKHTAQFNLSVPFQSAYKGNHSFETALLKVQNDFLQAMDNQKVGVLILLDLSTAFDTLNHTLLLKSLTNELGLSGKALAWFRSYLEGRFQQVKIGRQCSSKHKVDYGVPRG